METVLRVARDTAIVCAHQMMMRARRLLAPVLTRAERRRARHALRLAEAFLRRAILLLALELEAELPAPCAAQAGTGKARAPAPRPHSFRLVDPAPRFVAGGSLPAGGFDGLGPDDEVTPGALLARRARLEAAFAQPVARARRLAFWRRRQRATGRTGLPQRWPLPARGQGAGRDILDWLSWIDGAVRDGLHPAPG